MSKDKYGNTLQTGSPFFERYYFNHKLPFSKKKANNFEWVEKMCDYYDYYYGDQLFGDKQKNMLLNYDLFNGRGEKAMEQYNREFGVSILAEEGFNGGFESVQHFDIISHIAKAMVGEQKKRPLKPTVIDTSGYALNQRKRKQLELMQQYLQETILMPIEQEVTQKYLQEMGITDIYSMSPEEQQQMMSDVSQRTQAMAPKEILEYMRKDYKAPSERQAQKLLDYLIKELDIKYVTDEGFKHMIISGEQIYHVGILHDMPFLKLINPLGFTWSGTPNTFFIEDGEWCKYEEMVKFSDFFNEFGDQLNSTELIKLERIFEGNNSMENHRGRFESRLVSVIDVNPQIIEGVDIRNRDGQNFMQQMYQNYGDKFAHADLRRVHVNFKSLRKLKNIRRMDEKGQVNSFWVDESYEFNPLKGDIEEHIAWVPEVWEATKFGTIDALYFNKRPVPNQYRSLQNPWNVKLSYYGAQSSRLMGNSRNVSPVDLGKPWQYKFNVQMARLHEIEATDIGKVLLTTFTALPDGWTWGKFLKMMKYGKIAPINSQSEGLSANDMQAIRSLDLSTIQDLSSRLQYLEWLRNQVSTAMHYNPSRLGDVSPYTAVTNNQQNIIQSSHQTEDIYSLHNKVVENILNALVDVSRHAFKNNEFRKTYLMDDMGIAELEIDGESLWRSEIGVFVSSSTEDFNNIEIIKQQAQAMIQNGLISFPELIKLQWSKNYGDVLNIAEQAEERAEQMRQEQMQQEQAMQEQQMQMQMQMEASRQEFEIMKLQMELEGKLAITAIDSQKFANQYDIDMNKINDGNEKQQMINEHNMQVEKLKKELEEKKLALQKQKMIIDKQLKEKEIEVKKIQAKKPRSSK
jgi:hypothetical protein